MIDKEKNIIISLGGSLIYPKEGIDVKFLRKFNEFIRKQVAQGKKFFIVCGGGYIARKYQSSGKEIVGGIKPEDVDWLGIHATRMNAHLMRTVFRDIAFPKIIDQYEYKETIKQPITIAAGWKPGWSTDYCAVKLAQNYGAETLVNLSNIDTVFDKDPAIHKDAIPIEKTSWEYFRFLTGDKWDPGANVPFDPIASKLAQQLDLTVIILKGNDIDNLEKVFTGKKFKGTVIAPSRIDASFYNRDHFEGSKIGSIKIYSSLGRFLLLLRDLYRALKVKIFLRPKSLLDVGCGTGEMVQILRILGVRAEGLEISDYLLSLVSPKARKYLKSGNILNLPYKDNSFEVVTTGEVLEHLPIEDLKIAINECNRVAQKYTLHKIFTSENWWIKNTHSLDISHISIFTKDWWLRYWQENGFSLAKKFYPSLPSFMETLFLLEKK